MIGIVNQIRSHGETLEERRIVEKLLRCLPSKFYVIVTTIEETKDLSQFTVDKLHASLITHEQRLSRDEHSSLEHTFKTQMPSGRGKGQGKGRGRGRSQNRGGRNSPSHSHGRSNSQNQSHDQCNSQQGGHQHQHAHGQRYDKSNVQCHYCKKYGHYANECRKKKSDMKNKQNANVAKEEKNPSNVLLACNVALDREDDVWFLDSGCSNHMTRNREMFANLDEEIKSEVTTGMDTKISVKGKGRVSIRERNGEQKFVPDVYYVPGLKCNILSVG